MMNFSNKLLLKLGKTSQKATKKLDSFLEDWVSQHASEDDLKDSGHPWTKKEIDSANILAEQLKAISFQPLISIIMPVYRPDFGFFGQVLDSIEHQSYTNWQLCICDDAGKDPKVSDLIEAFANRYPDQTSISIHKENKHICEASNSALALAQGEFVVFVDHDDRLYPSALAEIVRHLYVHDKPDMMYSDEEHIDELGRLSGKIFKKPDWDPILHLSTNYSTHLSCYKTELVKRLGGLRAGFEGAQDHDLALRVSEKAEKIIHIPKSLYQWRIHENSTAANVEGKPYALKSGVRAVEEAVRRRGIKAEVSVDVETLHYKLNFIAPASRPLVDIILLGDNDQNKLKRCVQSVIRASDYDNFKIHTPIKLDKINDGRLHLRPSSLEPTGEFWLKDKFLKGQYAAFLNISCEILSPEWLLEAIGWLQIENIGCVFPKQIFADNRIFQAGFLYEKGSGFSRKYAGLADKSEEGFYFNQSPQTILAGSVDCFVMRREDFFATKGLPSLFLNDDFRSIYFSQSIKTSLNKHNLYSPYAFVYNHKSFEDLPVKIDNQELALLIKRGL